MTKLILLHTVVVLHFTHHIKTALMVTGGTLSKCSKTLYYKKLLETYKPVGKYQFAMACIRALVMSAYKVINCLISQPKHMLWVHKRTVSMRRFFGAPNYRLNMICMKVLTILPQKLCLSRL